MAGKENGEWVLVEGLSGGAGTGSRASRGGRLCDLEVCAGFAIGDGAEGIPDALLVGGPQGGEGPCPGSGTPSRKIVVEPKAGGFQGARPPKSRREEGGRRKCGHSAVGLR